MHKILYYCIFYLYVHVLNYDLCQAMIAEDNNFVIKYREIKKLELFKYIFTAYLYFNIFFICLFFLSPEKRRLSMCVGCGSQIHDQFILRVAPDLEWHASCLKCADCNQFLDENCTCFVREGKTYCRKDYVRWETKIPQTTRRLFFPV